MPIIIKNPGPGIDEFIMLEMQGDLENRDEEIKDCSGAFAGDLLFTKHGQPVSLIESNEEILILKYPSTHNFNLLHRYSSSATIFYMAKKS